MGRKDSPILSYLRGRHTDVGWTDERLPKDSAFYTYDWYVSHGYRHIVTPEQLAYAPNRYVNAHISYLPWNRGASPNAWAWYDSTPHGVTLHQITEGIDTGPIYAQAQCHFMNPKRDTLATTYAYLQETIARLFREEWAKITSGERQPFQQEGNGSYHSLADTERIITPLLTDGWNTPVSVLADAGKQARHKGNA